jgi:hypothetical protein
MGHWYWGQSGLDSRAFSFFKIERRLNFRFCAQAELDVTTERTSLENECDRLCCATALPAISASRELSIEVVLVLATAADFRPNLIYY